MEIAKRLALKASAFSVTPASAPRLPSAAGVLERIPSHPSHWTLLPERVGDPLVSPRRVWSLASVARPLPSSVSDVCDLSDIYIVVQEGGVANVRNVYGPVSALR
jgi:hypothetical protein